MAPQDLHVQAESPGLILETSLSSPHPVHLESLLSQDFKTDPFPAPIPPLLCPTFACLTLFPPRSTLQPRPSVPYMQPEGPYEHLSHSSAQSPPVVPSCSPWPTRPPVICPHHHFDLISCTFLLACPDPATLAPPCSFSLTHKHTPTSRPFCHPFSLAGMPFWHITTFLLSFKSLLKCFLLGQDFPEPCYEKC